MAEESVKKEDAQDDDDLFGDKSSERATSPSPPAKQEASAPEVKLKVEQDAEGLFETPEKEEGEVQQPQKQQNDSASPAPSPASVPRKTVTIRNEKSKSTEPKRKGTPGSKFGLPEEVNVPDTIEPRLLEGTTLEILKGLPPNLVNEALIEYDDAVHNKTKNKIRNHGAYLFGVVKRYKSVQERAKYDVTAIPMGPEITPTVQTALDKLVQDHVCTEEEMNDKVRSKIRMLSEKDALFAIEELASVPRSRINCFGSYFMGILNRYMRGDRKHKHDEHRGGGHDHYGRGGNDRRRRGRSPDRDSYRRGDRGSDRNDSYRRERSRDRFDDRSRQQTFVPRQQHLVQPPQQQQYSQPPPPPPQPMMNMQQQPLTGTFQQQQQPFYPQQSGNIAPAPFGNPAMPPASSFPGQQQQQPPNMPNQQQPTMMGQQSMMGQPPMMMNQQQPKPPQMMQQPVGVGMPQQQQQQPMGIGMPQQQQGMAPLGMPQQQQGMTQFGMPQQHYGAPGTIQQVPQQSGGQADILGLADQAAKALAGNANQQMPPMQQQQQGNMPQMYQTMQQQSGPPNVFNQYGGSAPPPSQHQYRPQPQLGSGSRRSTAQMHELPGSVQFAVQNLQAAGHVEGPLDEGMLGMIKDLPEPNALHSLQRFSNMDKTSMRSRTAYLAGLLRRDLEKIQRR